MPTVDVEQAQIFQEPTAVASSVHCPKKIMAPLGKGVSGFGRWDFAYSFDPKQRPGIHSYVDFWE